MPELAVTQFFGCRGFSYSSPMHKLHVSIKTVMWYFGLMCLLSVLRSPRVRGVEWIDVRVGSCCLYSYSELRSNCIKHCTSLTSLREYGFNHSLCKVLKLSCGIYLHRLSILYLHRVSKCLRDGEKSV